ncbi:Fe-S cluster assembly sulfur transfer protein SufU [Longimicrobium sp.]|uniref:Fe-S cluster assembly sulfur transfer protein SufU n=1 Tax=Longimicrobium sp. TaxID=2029185 RepID=UPI002D15FE9C|nr:SUF system NifU family Fe-S cluster assembly protein [Longimicrobium sp.]HSU17763.1 SUF system NifU family Fe-S cluster assembly protein [Longimicrobium sp.]
MSLPLDGIYQELILRHYRSPAHRGEMDAPDAVVMMRNPTCGDDIVLQLRVSGGVIEDVRFKGQGCAISQASASMMSGLIAGKTFAEAEPLLARFRDMIHGDAEAARDKQLGDLRALSGVARLPRRVKCAMLPWDALEEARKQLPEV